MCVTGINGFNHRNKTNLYKHIGFIFIIINMSTTIGKFSTKSYGMEAQLSTMKNSKQYRKNNPHAPCTGSAAIVQNKIKKMKNSILKASFGLNIIQNLLQLFILESTFQATEERRKSESESLKNKRYRCERRDIFIK